MTTSEKARIVSAVKQSMVPHLENEQEFLSNDFSLNLFEPLEVMIISRAPIQNIAMVLMKYGADVMVLFTPGFMRKEEVLLSNNCDRMSPMFLVSKMTDEMVDIFQCVVPEFTDMLEYQKWPRILCRLHEPEMKSINQKGGK